MTTTGARTLIDRTETIRHDIRCELLSHNVHAVSYGNTECDCRQCLMLGPLPGLLAELGDAIRCRVVLTTIE